MRIMLVFLLSLFPLSAFAAHKEQPVEQNSKCLATPSVIAKKMKDNYPGRNGVVSSNDLALPEGKSVYANGQRIYISGHVLDKNCVPVSDAIVEIWQADPNGKYIKSTRGDRLSPFPDFTGSGRAITNNLGEYRFVTLFPGIENAKRAPFIHVRVSREGFPPVNTEMFFEGDSRNADDIIFKKLKDDERNRLQAKVTPLTEPQDALEAKWDVTLKGFNEFRKY